MPTAAQSSSPPKGWLPEDVVRNIAAYLSEPLNLYRASKVNRTWRSAIITSSSWEDAYWQIYRPRLDKNDEQRAILAARMQTRRREMRAWLQSTSSSPPTYDTFERLLRESEVQEDDMRELLRSMCHGKDLEDVPPYTASDIMTPLAGLPTQAVPLPHFLRLNAPLPATKAPRPDFHALFVSRLKRDERLLRQLIECGQRSDETLDGMLRLLEEHGDDARELLSALCATQRASSDYLEEPLASTTPGDSAPSLRAFDIHRLAGQGRPHPHANLFLTLRFIAEQMLSYLQRREAVKSLKGLTARAESRGEGNENCTAKQAAFRGGKGSEQCYEDFALFFSGDRVQIREYLDLLALFVWAELQAQDRRTSLDGTIYGAPPHRKLLPLNSTRHLSARISHILRALGFGSAPKHQQKDFANSWLHASLFCPTQRLTSEFTVSTIACSVMPRLGVSSQPNDMPFRTFCFAVEQTPQPDGWAGENCNKVWEYFYCDVHEVESRLVAEPDEVQKLLFSMCCFEKAFLSPTPPKNIALRLVGELLGSVQRVTTVTTLGETMSAEESRPARIHAEAPPPQGPLAELRHYLEGRQVDHPPEELPPPTLAASLASLPSVTTLNAPRLEPMHRRSEVELAAYWYLAAVDPYQFGGPRKAEEKLCDLLAPWLAEGLSHLLDPFLMVETSNAPSPALRRVKHTLLAKDKVGSEGIGGYGGGNEVKKGRAQWSEEEKQQRLDRSAWPEVKYGVGSLFKHRKTGKAAVVVGWDSERRNAKELREGIAMDTAPYGPTQPHHHAIDENGLMRYVAQANVQPTTIAPGSSPQEVGQQLKGFDRLLQVSKLGRCFRTLRVQGTKGGKEGQVEEGSVMLVLNEWMKEAWPFD